MGDPSGIGPEIIVKSLSSLPIRDIAHFIVIGDGFVFKKAVDLTKADFEYNVIEGPGPGQLNLKVGPDPTFIDLKNINAENFKFGYVSAEYGKASIEYVKLAHSLIKAGLIDAIVTAPINKYSAKKGGFKHQGHTEFLKELSKAGNVAMMLASDPLSIVLATTHLSLSDAIRSLKNKRIFNLICLIDKWMRDYFGIENCKIGVCGLNPHAGEKGVLGNEEKNIIEPAVKMAKSKGINVTGPLPADTLFNKAYNNVFGVVLCMYHDQGLIPIKMVAMNEAVNITLGLPFVRTSPAHGTAFDIAGKNIAQKNSFSAAITTAVSMVARKKCIQHLK